MWHRNSSRTYLQENLVTSQIAEVRALGVIAICTQDDLQCILALDLLPKPDGKFRLILNGHPLAEYELPRPFKMEHLSKEGRYIFAGCTHGSILDISNAFYHIDMAPISRKYLGFEWLGTFYHYISLPQGITPAPFIFTEVAKPMVQSWRARGIRVLPYLDDFPSGAPSSLQQQLHCHYMVEHMSSLGFILKEKKLFGYPVPAVEIFALGCAVSFTSQTFSLNSTQIQEIQGLVSSLLSVRSCPVKTIARLAGLLVSRSHCLGPAARLRTRSMYRNIEERLKPHERLFPLHTSRALGWSRRINILARTKAELTFWLKHLVRVNGQPFQRCLLHRTLHIDLDTDASKHGWGAILYLPDPTRSPDVILLAAAQRTLPPRMTLVAIQSALHHGIRIAGTFSLEEAQESSNARKLFNHFIHS